MTDEQIKKRNKRQNEWTAANYERQTITLPNGTKEKILAAGEKSVNGFINRLVKEYLEKVEKDQGKKDHT